MNKEEQSAQEYLRAISNDLVYEPDGKVPPDFKLNQVIAVEVRRLNQNISKGQKLKGLEQERIKLYHALLNVFRGFDSLVAADNYWIGLHFQRPVGKVSDIQGAAKGRLLDFLRDKPPVPFDIRLSQNVSITINKANRKSPEIFHIGIVSDRDSGGWVGSLYSDNINHCIAEKTRRIQKYKSKYFEWWLVLVDFLAGGIGEPEKTFVIQHINKGEDWKRTVVIHPDTKKEIISIG